MVAQTRTKGQPSPKKLAFSEKLVGKGLTTDVLLKKLKSLHTQLAELDQELVDVNSLGSVRKELISTSILLHKDRGVKAYAACCLADILRLYAPDAPYTHTELRDIFSFFFRQLVAGLKGTESSYYEEYFHLLESLSTVKSVVLVCDLPQAEELMASIFRDSFALVRRDLAKKIEMFVADILVALVDECQALPGDVLETIMSQFMDKNARMDQPAYRLAVQVCNATSDKLQRHVCQYFTDIIVAHSQDEEYDDIRTAHDLIKQLNRSCPSLLQSVVPQLEEELRVEEVQLRLIVTQVLGEMFSDKGGADLVKKYPTTWAVWLNRKNDKSPAIRLKFIEAAKGLLMNLPEMRDVVDEMLQSKLMDPDEKVRAAACKVYSQLDYETALHHVSAAQLRAVAGRGLDKKQHVRSEALNSIAKLYNLAYPEIENNDPAAIQQFSWIPHEILHMATSGSVVKADVERVLAEYIFPLPSASLSSTLKGNENDEAAWTDRLLNILKYLDDSTVKALLGMTGVKGSRPNIYENFVLTCVQNNGGIIDENEEVITRKLGVIVQHISSSFPDPIKAAEDLHAFAKLNESRLYKLLKTCTDTQTDVKTLVKATSDFLRRMDQSSSAIAPTMATFIRRASLRIINQSSIPALIKRLQKGGSGKTSSQGSVSARNAQLLLVFVSKHCPALFKSHVGELTKAIADEKNPTLVEACLQALSAAVRWDDRLAPNDKGTNERIVRYALESNERHAKFASRLLAFAKNRDEVCAQVVDTIAIGLPSADPELQAANIAVLAQFAKLAPDAFDQKSDVIMGFLLKQVLMVPTQPDLEAMDVDIEWFEDYEITPELRAKILSLKVCRNRSLAYSSSESALEISTPVLKMFTTLILNNGSFQPDSEDPRVMSRMRLQAAISLLHLSTIEFYAKAIAPQFINLALTVQHPCYHVRMAFLSKLVALLTPRKLPPRFNVIPFLTVHDPEADVKQTASAYIAFAFRSFPAAVKVDHLEIIFIRLLHFLAHHPDFAVSHDELPDIAKYVDFYIDHIGTADTISLLYHLAMKVKTVQDTDPQFNENLYVMSELAQELIKIRAHVQSWSIQSYPGKVKLPSDILKALPSVDTANKILKKVFLPEQTAAWLAESAKVTKTSSNSKEKKPKAERKVTGKRKAALSKSDSHTKRSRQGKRRQTNESDEEAASALEDSDVEMMKSASGEDEGDEDVPETEREEKLGRAARTRAKAKIRQQTKGTAKSKGKPPSSDG